MSTSARPIAEENLSRPARRARTDVERAMAALRRFDLHSFADLERRAGRSPVPGEEGAGAELADGWPTSLRRDPQGGGVRRCRVTDMVDGQVVRCPLDAVPGRIGCAEHSTPDDEELGLLPPPPEADPVGELAARAADGEVALVDPVPGEVALAYSELRQAAALATRAAARMDRIQRNARLGRESSVGRCECCEATVTGVGEDRLRGGFCPSCAKAWERVRSAHEGPGAADRLAFVRTRRTWLQERSA
ncbi:MAG TPA: hypothetical protein VFJ85_02900 [Acidimicrobiales bacterium]|nr:hypothetical protein [Acidimicrobiales bacterium]